LSTKTLTGQPPRRPRRRARRQRDGLLHRLVHVGHRGEAVVGEDLHGDLLVRAGQADHDRHLERVLLRRGHDTVGHVVGARDAAEDVEQDGLDVLVGRDDAQRVDDLLGVDEPPMSRKLAGSPP
jgi:hypothetical protein